MDTEQLTSWRAEVLRVLGVLAESVRCDNNDLVDAAPKTVAAVLRSYDVKHVAFMRELTLVCCPRDYAAVSYLVVGLPMLEGAPPAYGLLERVRPPMASYDEWRGGREMRNLKVVNRIRSSGDSNLGCGSYAVP